VGTRENGIKTVTIQPSGTGICGSIALGSVSMPFMGYAVVVGIAEVEEVVALPAEDIVIEAGKEGPVRLAV